METAGRELASFGDLHLAVPECAKGIGEVIGSADSPHLIAGVRVEALRLYPDDRGYFLEVQRLGHGLAAGFPAATSQVSAALSYPGTVTAISPTMIDWSATRAWGDGGYYGRLFLNVRGREPQGSIDAADYERVRDDLIAAVAALTDSEGRNIGSRAYRPEELYRQTAGVPPDLLVYFGDLSWRSIGSVGRHGIYATENDTGPDDANHDWNGIFIIRDGRRDLGGTRLEGLDLMDVAPTVRKKREEAFVEA